MAIISVLSWILLFIFPTEDLFLYFPTGYACIILFYAILATAALSLTYAAYKFGERVEAGTYILGSLPKFVDYSAFALIAVMASSPVDFVRPLLGMVGFMWQFHCLMKLGWKFVDYTFAEMLLIDTLCITTLFAVRRTRIDMEYSTIVIFSLLFSVFFGAMKYSVYWMIFDTIEDRSCGVCILAMERYPEKVVELLESWMLESIVDEPTQIIVQS
ncbi:hypothetical protein LINGRAHAP2_LOCUS33115 [Linum grandiflorum]